MLRDLIALSLSSLEDMDAAFLFLDQEKAFDRVDYEFVYQTLKTFGMGENFITLIQQIYSNAVTKVKVKGLITESISLDRGVRQCNTHSFLLYLFNIELLAL